MSLRNLDQANDRSEREKPTGAGGDVYDGPDVSSGMDETRSSELTARLLWLKTGGDPASLKHTALLRNQAACTRFPLLPVDWAATSRVDLVISLEDKSAAAQDVGRTCYK
jgi:hypothetical protein